MADYNSDRTGSNIDAVLDKADNLTQAAVGVGGNVGIGTASPSDELHIKANSTPRLRIDAGLSGQKSNLLFINSADGTYAQIENEGSALTFLTQATERARIDSSGNLLVGTTSSPTGSGQIVANNGIYLGGTGAANKLDDYETGSWTPNVEGTSSVGTVAYTTRIARYVKVGNLVTATVRVAYNTLTGTGNLVITGLPFTASAYGVLYVGAVEFSGITYTGTPSALIGASDNKIKLEQYTSGGGATALPVDASGDIRINITYEVA